MTRDALTLAALRDLTPSQAAARWMASEDLDRSPEREALALWLDASPANRQAWDKAQRMWDVFDDAQDSDLIAAMARAARQARPTPVAKTLWPLLVAASVAIAIVSTALVAGVQSGWFDKSAAPIQAASKASSPSLNAIGRADYATGQGQKSIVDLPDGTRVTLDADSALDVAFEAGTRQVRLLGGRAFFDVAHDPAHPFAVEASGRLVTALGTQFDVRLTPGAMRVVLAEGSVSVGSAPGGPVTSLVRLAPGEAFAAQDGAKGVVTSTDVDQALAWKQGVVEFKDRPLSEAVGQLNRYTRAQIVIRDPKVGALRVTGVFRTGDIKRFGRSVSQVLPVRMIPRGADTYELVSIRP